MDVTEGPAASTPSPAPTAESHDATTDDVVAAPGNAIDDLRLCMDCKDPKQLVDGIKCASCLREQEMIVGGSDEFDPWSIRVWKDRKHSTLALEVSEAALPLPKFDRGGGVQ